MKGHSEIQALSRVLDALYQSVTEAKGWENFKIALSEWLGASGCEFQLLEGSGQLALPPTRIPTSNPSAVTHEYTARATVGEKQVELSMRRPLDAPAFGARERRRLDIVATHLAQAIELRRMMVGKEETTRGAKTALERVPLSVALLGRRGEVHLSSARFKAVATDSAYLSILDGHLVLRDPQQQARLLDHLGALSARTSAPLTFLLEAKARERQYGTVRSLLGSVKPTEWPTTEREAVAVLMLESVPALESPDAAQISEALRISPAQGRLVAAIFAGKSIKEYAFESGISIHTARTHLKKVFVALDIKSQAALTRIVAMRVRASGAEA